MADALTAVETEPETDDLTEGERQAWSSLTKTKQHKLMGEAMKIHQNTSHRPGRVLAANLRLAGAKPASVAAMKMIKCDACAENKTPLPRPPVGMQEPESRIPWEIVGIDIKEVTETTKDEKIRYLVLVDEVSKLARFVELFTTGVSQARNATEVEVLRAYDCLLYTSPSPRDRTRSRMPSSA